MGETAAHGRARLARGDDASPGSLQTPTRDDRQLTVDEARRITLFAQGFLGADGRRGGVAPAGTCDPQATPIVNVPYRADYVFING